LSPGPWDIVPIHVHRSSGEEIWTVTEPIHVHRSSGEEIWTVTEPIHVHRSLGEEIWAKLRRD